jgi:hypothetical protein
MTDSLKSDAVQDFTSPAHAPRLPPATITVSSSRLVWPTGDIRGSYSADRIGMDQPVRRPFKYGNALWVCTSSYGSSLNASGCEECEAYQLRAKDLFVGAPATYHEKTGTPEGAEAARHDPNGSYHGMNVKFAAAVYVLCGPPTRFTAPERPEPHASEPCQLSLF